MGTQVAEILQFPKITCESCVNLLTGTYGPFCREFLEDIINLDIAEECNAFEVDS